MLAYNLVIIMCMLCKNKSYNYLCDECYKKYPIDMKMEYIPLDKYNCYILSLFQKNIRFDYNYYINEYSQIFKFFNKLRYHIIFIENIKMDIDSYLELDMITKLVKKDILVMSFKTIET